MYFIAQYVHAQSDELEITTTKLRVEVYLFMFGNFWRFAVFSPEFKRLYYLMN